MHEITISTYKQFHEKYKVQMFYVIALNIRITWTHRASGIGETIGVQQRTRRQPECNTASRPVRPVSYQMALDCLDSQGGAAACDYSWEPESDAARVRRAHRSSSPECRCVNLLLLPLCARLPERAFERESEIRPASPLCNATRGNRSLQSCAMYSVHRTWYNCRTYLYNCRTLYMYLYNCRTYITSTVRGAFKK